MTRRAERREIQEIGARVRQMLSRCREHWVLPVYTRYLDREVASLAWVLWSNLEESRPARLRRYGEVPQALQAPLECDIEELAALVVRLAQIHR